MPKTGFPGQEENDFEVNPYGPPRMVSIPAGWFLMGTSDSQVMEMCNKEQWAIEWYEDDLFRVEKPQHKVYLAAYEIGLHPVTNMEYFRFVWESNYKVPKGWQGFRFPEGLDKHPIANITMADAMAYCEWLGKKFGGTYRLPTEAEWERAARGATSRIYPWGNDFDPWRCNTLESSKGGTTQVGSYTPAGDSPVGCVDMAGNVYEWTSSRLVSYPYTPTPPPPEPGERVRYVVRGGAYYYSRKLARCSSREGIPKDYISPALGFRMVKNIEPGNDETKPGGEGNPPGPKQ
jgi:formylglycine-generating enzyme required for sulfatase activity